MRIRTKSLVVLAGFAFASVCAAAACSSFSGTNSATADASVLDGAIGSDAGSQNDGSTGSSDAGMPANAFDATLACPPGAVICDDFERDTANLLNGFWTPDPASPTLTDMRIATDPKTGNHYLQTTCAECNGSSIQTMMLLRTISMTGNTFTFDLDVGWSGLTTGSINAFVLQFLAVDAGPSQNLAAVFVGAGNSPEQIAMALQTDRTDGVTVESTQANLSSTHFTLSVQITDAGSAVATLSSPAFTKPVVLTSKLTAGQFSNTLSLVAVGESFISAGEAGTTVVSTDNVVLGVSN